MAEEPPAEEAVTPPVPPSPEGTVYVLREDFRPWVVPDKHGNPPCPFITLE